MDNNLDKSKIMSLLQASIGDNFKITDANFTASNGTVGMNMSWTTDSSNNAMYTMNSGTSNLYYLSNITPWNYWTNYYYPYVIKESYPVYIQERAMDKGKQAFEIIKALMDKKFIKLEKVSDFVDAMDILIKTL